MTTEAAQLPLAVYLRDDATLDNFLFQAAPGPLHATLKNQPTAAGEHFVYLHGNNGTGRSHLLQAACHEQAAGEALYLPLEQLTELPAAELLADVESLALVSLDNLDAVTGDAAWEEALFNLFNRARESGCRLLFSANCAPRQLALGLPDLQSRLSWAVVYQLPEPTDEDKLRILQFRARRRGMSLSDEAGNFILARASRSLVELMEILDRLDRDSMVAQRQLSIPFIKSCLGW
jgi:DnaA family protein